MESRAELVLSGRAQARGAAAGGRTECWRSPEATPLGFSKLPEAALL
jgi:hypothetical protein